MRIFLINYYYYIYTSINRFYTNKVSRILLLINVHIFNIYKFFYHCMHSVYEVILNAKIMICFHKKIDYFKQPNISDSRARFHVNKKLVLIYQFKLSNIFGGIVGDIHFELDH